MNLSRQIVIAAAVFAASTATAATAMAQQITGTPGSPSATTTIDGKQIPAPPLPFGGVIKESYKDSKPFWPPQVVPPKGAPNVLLKLGPAQMLPADQKAVDEMKKRVSN